MEARLLSSDHSKKAGIFPAFYFNSFRNDEPACPVSVAC